MLVTTVRDAEAFLLQETRSQLASKSAVKPMLRTEIYTSLPKIGPRSGTRTTIHIHAVKPGLQTSGTYLPFN
jgi:hypothetical protein